MKEKKRGKRGKGKTCRDEERERPVEMWRNIRGRYGSKKSERDVEGEVKYLRRGED